MSVTTAANVSTAVLMLVLTCASSADASADDLAARTDNDDTRESSTLPSSHQLAGIARTTTVTATLEDACGDLDSNGQLEVNDAFLLLRAAVEATDCRLSRCDATGDGTITAADALVILRYAVGFSVVLACNTTTTTLSGCPTPLDEEQLAELAFGLDSIVEMTPGTSRTFELGLFECCYYIEPIDACATFSVSPAGAGARIDPDSGLLELDSDVPDGTRFTVIADVEDGRATVTESVYVYAPARNPLRGYRSEVMQIPCDGSDERPPIFPIRELVFHTYGVFEVTWEPFELYVDYWGNYVFDLDTGALSMTITGGNYVPTDFDGDGYVTFEGDQIVLHDIWLGSPRDGYNPGACGHRFE